MGQHLGMSWQTQVPVPKTNDAVREIYYGLLECAKAFPKEYVDGCPYTYDVVYKAIKSEIIEKYLQPDIK